MKLRRPLMALALAIPLSADLCRPKITAPSAENPFKGMTVHDASKIMGIGESANFSCVPINADGFSTQGEMKYSAEGTSVSSTPNIGLGLPSLNLKAVSVGVTTFTCNFTAVTGEKISGSGRYEVKDLIIELTPAAQTLAKGDKGLLSVTVRHPDGSVIPSSQGTLTWTSSATQFVTLAPFTQTHGAEATAVNGPGTSTITATFVRPKINGLFTEDQKGSATATINVVTVPVPPSTSLTVSTPSPSYSVTANSSVFVPYAVQDANGSAVTDATITSSITGACTILSSSAASILVRGTAAGACSLTINAAKNGATGSKVVPITVNAAAATVANLVAPGTGGPVGSARQLTGVMPTGELVAFTAMAGIAGSSIPWANQTATSFTSSNTAVATVSSTGVVTGISAGTAGITAQWSSGGVDYTASYSAVVGPLETATPSSITIATMSGLSTTVRVGKVTAYLCTASTGGVATVANQVWTSSNTAVATVNSAGIVTGVSAGTSTITCNINSRTTTMSTTVTP
jgi:hypothetical protein